jgi:CTP synthase
MSALADAYKSLNEALAHGGFANRVKVNINWIDAELFEKTTATLLPHWNRCTRSWFPADLVNAARKARLLLSASPANARCRFSVSASGMQMACIEGARNTAGIAEASSTEFGPTDEPVVGIITEWMTEEGLQSAKLAAIWAVRCGLGAYDASLAGNSHVAEIYGSDRYF